MVATATTPAKRDDFWALARAAAYLRGKGVTYGPPLLQAGAIQPGVYSIPVGIVKTPGIAAVDGSLGIFADGSLDHILMTPMLAAFPDPLPLLRECGVKLRVGGHLVLLVDVEPRGDERPLFQPDQIRSWLREVAHWRVKDEWTENGRYLLVLKRVEGRRGLDPQVASSGKKRVCIARYGALGDAIIMTPLVRQLAEDGYEVTLNISSYCAPVFENNPHVSNLLIQERDLIPNHLLGRYWGYWKTQYDRYINLSESIEGDLLIVEGRPPFFSSKAWRHSKCNRNYYDYTMERGGYPDSHGKRGELYFTRAEERRASIYFTPLAAHFTLLWALNGSSHHKVYPMMEALLRDWLPRHPLARCITTGDQQARLLEFDHPQVLPQAARWSIREALIATRYASCVIGPETMMTNAAGCWSTPTITLLSHSSHENLCKHWEGDFCLSPDITIAPCYPCHQLHYGLQGSCPIGTLEDTVNGEELGKAPICSMSISPERVMQQLENLYACWEEGRTPQSSDRIDRPDIWETQDSKSGAC